MIEIDRFTDIGVQRESNEDNYIYFRCQLDGKDIVVACVCDGMGGLEAGEYASKELCESLKRGIYSENFSSIDELKRTITNSFKEANRTIYKTKTQYGKQCGTTGTCVLLADKGYVWHVGDTRVIKVSSKGVRVLTKDHTYVRRLVEKGDLTEEQARLHPKRNVLVNAVGVYKDVPIDMFEFDYENSMLMLATDGFWHGLKDSDYRSLATKTATLQDMFEKVKRRGETDNITGLVLHC